MRGIKKVNSIRFCPLTVGCLLVCLAAAITFGGELPKGAVVLDPDVLMYDRPEQTISPDGKWVAYISKGFATVCSVADPSPRKLLELPGTWTHILARPENASARNTIGRGLAGDEYLKLQPQVKGTAYGMHWTPTSDGLSVGIRSEDVDRKITTNNIWYAPVEGEPTSLARVSRGFDEDMIRGTVTDFQLTRDRRFLVLYGLRRPLIWDISTNEPHATCFLHLTPSPTSGRWIGIEKDTRQLVITNENFEVVKRFDETRPAKSWGFKLDWSPDE
jgi:hypothetical protein